MLPQWNVSSAFTRLTGKLNDEAVQANDKNQKQASNLIDESWMDPAFRALVHKDYIKPNLSSNAQSMGSSFESKSTANGFLDQRPKSTSSRSSRPSRTRRYSSFDAASFRHLSPILPAFPDGTSSIMDGSWPAEFHSLLLPSSAGKAFSCWNDISEQSHICKGSSAVGSPDHAYSVGTDQLRKSALPVDAKANERQSLLSHPITPDTKRGISTNHSLPNNNHETSESPDKSKMSLLRNSRGSPQRCPHGTRSFQLIHFDAGYGYSIDEDIEDYIIDVLGRAAAIPIEFQYDYREGMRIIRIFLTIRFGPSLLSRSMGILHRVIDDAPEDPNEANFLGIWARWKYPHAHRNVCIVYIEA